MWFISEIQWDDRACVWGLEPYARTYGPLAVVPWLPAALFSGVLGDTGPLLCPCPVTTDVTLCPQRGLAPGKRRVRVGGMHTRSESQGSQAPGGWVVCTPREVCADPRPEEAPHQIADEKHHERSRETPWEKGQSFSLAF